MMLDRDIVAVSPSSTYRVLKNAGLMRHWNKKDSKKGEGFVQPSKAHGHWHVDVSYLNTLCVRISTAPFIIFVDSLMVLAVT
jgi:hypothetical protein